MTNQTNAAQAAKQHPIDEAIVILSAEAESIRECHTPGRDRNDWTGESEARAAHDNMLRVAAALSALRAPVADERAAQEYGSPADVAQRIEQYLAQDGRMNSGTQLLYEAMKALRASQGDRNDG